LLTTIQPKTRKQAGKTCQLHGNVNIRPAVLQKTNDNLRKHDEQHGATTLCAATTLTLREQQARKRHEEIALSERSVQNIRTGRCYDDSGLEKLYELELSSAKLYEQFLAVVQSKIVVAT